MIKGLNSQQRLIHDYIYDWCIKMRVSELNSSQTPDPFHLFLSGCGGVGKSYVVHSIYQSAIRAFRFPGRDPDLPTVLLTASTGKAAVNISGTTVHSAFSIPIKKK